jgi:hypothetical protein
MGNTLRYLFYLRISIFFGGLLLGLFALCIFAFPVLLENIGELESPWQFLAVTLAATVFAKAIISTFFTTLSNAHLRFPVLIEATGLRNYLDVAFFTLRRVTITRRDLVAFILILPTMIWVALRSAETVSWWTWLIAFFVSWLFLYSYRLLASKEQPRWFVASLTLVLNHLGPGYLNDVKGKSTHLRAAVFWVVASIIYLFGFWFLEPSEQFETPALVFLFLLLTGVCLFLGAMAFYLDRYMIPTIVSFVVISIGSYGLWKTDHFYQLEQSPLNDADQAAVFKALQTRLAVQEQGGKTLVLVATAGGGIQASAWTAIVLAGIEQELASIAPFSKEVAFISSVSGGAVGTLFYVDGFDETGGLDLDEQENIVERATKGNLDAVTWGLAYGDFWRLIGLPFPKYVDRGAALEEDWARTMQTGDSSLMTWGQDALAGRKPITVFNATLIENGYRYLLSPFELETHNTTEAEKNEPLNLAEKSADVRKLYAGTDMKARTAARIASGFPYVSPAARNDLGDAIYHTADGGYVDNFGVFTLVNFVQRYVVPNLEEFQVKRILVLEIRSFAEPKVDAKEPNRFSGWFSQVFGPFQTLLSVRRSSQVSRTDYELGALRHQILQNQPTSDSLKFEIVRLTFPETFGEVNSTVGSRAFKPRGEGTPYQPPLSWQLSREQKLALKIAWADMVNNDPEFQRLVSLWSDWHRHK